MHLKRKGWKSNLFFFGRGHLFPRFFCRSIFAIFTMKGISPIFFFLLDVASLWPCVCMPFFLLLFEYEEEKLIGNVRVGATVSLLSWLIGRVRNDANKKISAFLFFFINLHTIKLQMSRNISYDYPIYLSILSSLWKREKRQQKFISNKNRRMR